jgi:6-pyruvoyltetrahydropterin/6-carboxytetrahydropterin synthase
MKKLLIHTETTIDSCHQLVGYKGVCERLHGHTWLLRIWARGTPEQLSEVGILFDFTSVKKIKEKYDHRYINDVSPFDLNETNPTAENLSIQIYNDLKEEYPDLEFCVRLYETKVGKETWCQYGDFSL